MVEAEITSFEWHLGMSWIFWPTCFPLDLFIHKTLETEIEMSETNILYSPVYIFFPTWDKDLRLTHSSFLLFHPHDQYPSIIYMSSEQLRTLS